MQPKLKRNILNDQDHVMGFPLVPALTRLRKADSDFLYSFNILCIVFWYSFYFSNIALSTIFANSLKCRRLAGRGGGDPHAYRQK